MLKVIAVLLICGYCFGLVTCKKQAKKLRQYYRDPNYLGSYYYQHVGNRILYSYLKVGCEISFTNKTDPFAKISINEVKKISGRSKIVTIGSRVSYQYICIKEYKVVSEWFDKGVGAKNDINCKWNQIIIKYTPPSQIAWKAKGDPRIRPYVLVFQSLAIPNYFLSIKPRKHRLGLNEILQPREFFKLKTENERFRAKCFHDFM